MMAQIQDNIPHTHPHPHKTKPSSFLRCFGFSGKIAEKRAPGTVNSPGGRKKTRWFSWSRFGIKKSAAKTVPIDVAVPLTANRSKPNHPHKKIYSKPKIPASRVGENQIPAASPGRIVDYKPQKTRHETAQNIILDVQNKSNVVDHPLKHETCLIKRLSFGRKIEAIKTGGVSLPVSPGERPNHSRTIKVLCHSISLPPPKQEKQQANSRGQNPPKSADKLAGKFNPIIGMSIVMVTLLIMVTWGRLCAILCTSAWFYFLPRLRSSSPSPSPSASARARARAMGSRVGVENGSGRVDPDPHFEEVHKKRVVLEGFLERKHRNGS